MNKAGKLFIVFFAVLGLIMGATLVKAPVASAADMTGTWDVSVQTPQGNGTPTFVLKQDGNKITGDYEGAFGKSKVAGSIDGDTFKIEYTMGGTKITYSGTIEGNKISGKAQFGPDSSGPFTGVKQ